MHINLSMRAAIYEPSVPSHAGGGNRAYAAYLLLQLLVIHQNIYYASGATNIRFVHGQYKLQSVEAAGTDALANVVNLPKPKSEFAPEKIEDFPWYHTLPDSLINDARRFSDSGKLFIRGLETVFRKGVTTQAYYYEYCSAFYVGVDLLMTAGHCVVHPGIAKPDEVLIAFVQAYNGKFSEGERSWNAHGRIVTDWWVPEKFYNHNDAEIAADAWGFDFAFLRVHKPKAARFPSQTYSFYNLLQPDASMIAAKSDVLMIGWPSDVPNYSRPVRVNAKLHAGSDKEVEGISPKLPGIAKAKKQLLLVGKDKGVMFRGASGGPVFRDTHDANDLNVIGLVSYYGQPNNKANLADKTKVKQEGVVTPLITGDVVAVLELLRQGPKGEAQITLAAGNPVTQICNWVCDLIRGN